MEIPHKTNEEIKKEAESSDYVGLPSFKLDNPVFNESDSRVYIFLFTDRFKMILC